MIVAAANRSARPSAVLAQPCGFEGDERRLADSNCWNPLYACNTEIPAYPVVLRRNHAAQSLDGSWFDPRCAHRSCLAESRLFSWVEQALCRGSRGGARRVSTLLSDSPSGRGVVAASRGRAASGGYGVSAPPPARRTTERPSTIPARGGHVASGSGSRVSSLPLPGLHAVCNACRWACREHRTPSPHQEAT